VSFSALVIEGVSLRLGSFALRDLSISVGSGEILVILGPSGAGKTVLLETIAGFNVPDAGKILIGGRDVTREVLERRRVAFMFQDYALFPHMTVRGNIAFGLAGTKKGNDAESRVRNLQSKLGLDAILDRKPAGLSGGEKQRVALARALAADPELFLFDEPLSALDSNTRDSLRDDLKAILGELGIPAIYVTHDQTEAQVLADRLAVIREGSFVQVGTPAGIFNSPADEFVARFVGMENVIEGSVVGAKGCGTMIDLPAARRIAAALDGFRAGSPVFACIRPEDVSISRQDSPRGTAISADGSYPSNRLEACVTTIEAYGPMLKIEMDCGFPLVSYLTKQAFFGLGLRTGDSVIAGLRAESVHLMKRCAKFH